ncbi:phosphopyruvate hydratase [Candidatus Uhrbacteria bacterium RIFCSPHIGHO2_02_FULL_57_19]|uniref:Enolase n=1 Tax=Candidatus Uhrbacteria bacterium RIFCSPHIGHO2_02_FULL_57_19 TaxID=1802391 RepID=A0A1F7U6X8_9BACT|nr:MAG: phosphopyruvate hydratase [Candidatus Uhrbacteria bacterium RIFCSPHIGHO2_02_FULL_57_19]
MVDKIAAIRAREILDSRGNPTVSVTVTLRSGAAGTASVPSGASTGSHEALELRDGNKARYGGKGVQKAVRNVNERIARMLRGVDIRRLQDIDHVMLEMDGTENKSKLGANAILGVSLACAHAGAASAGIPLYRHLREIYSLPTTVYRLPIPMMNVLNGGVHAGWAIDLQECMIIPRQRTFRERLRAGAEVFHALGKILKSKGYTTLVGDEGGYAPKLPGNEAALRLLMQAIREAGYRPGRDVALGMDAAASEFYDAKKGVYAMRSDGVKRNAAQMLLMYRRWIAAYPLISIEDPFAEDDWTSWAMLTKALGKKAQIVGDDLFVTNVKRLRKGIEMGVANAILIKVNQIGSLTETIDAIRLAQKHGYAIAVSHRSGETADTTIADLAVAVGAEYIKTGSLSRSERVEKYNRLMAIEEEILAK